MDATNPLLRDSELPAFSEIRPEHVVPAVEHLLADYRAAVEQLTASSGTRDFANTLLPQEAWDERLGRAWSPVSHLHSSRIRTNCARRIPPRWKRSPSIRPSWARIARSMPPSMRSRSAAISPPWRVRRAR